MTVKLFRCRHCGQIIFKVNDTSVPVVCCDEKMAELVANTTDAATEKHVPVVEVNGNVVTVKVGSVTHPMTEEHYIQWILVNTNKGVQLKELKPNQAPEASFVLQDGEEVIEVYEYCNLHSLWVKR
jgi:superoxide reductase